MAIINGTPDGDFIVASVEGAVAGDVIRGLGGNDMLLADVDHITLEGGEGNDELFSEFGTDGTIMDGGAGNDLLIGFGTNDTASYANDPAGVTVDLAGEATDGYGGTDSLFEIENVIGSAYDDTLIGDDLDNVLQGGGGNDTLTGNGGNDIFKYSFTLTPGDGGGGGETFHFTQFFADHGGLVVDGEVADGTKQGQFSSLYTQWLESLGLTVLDLGQNAGLDGMPVVEGPEGTFGERESFEWTSGGGKKTVTHERWYSDTWTSDTGSGGGQDTVASGDGFDTIIDFTWGEDKLEFQGLNGFTLAQFTSFFEKIESDVNGDDVMDTQLALIDGTWGVTLLSESGHSLEQFHDASLFS